MQTQLAVCELSSIQFGQRQCQRSSRVFTDSTAEIKSPQLDQWDESALHSAFCLAKNANFISTFFLHACGGLAAAVAGVIAFYLLLPAQGRGIRWCQHQAASFPCGFLARVQKPDNTSCVEHSSAGGGCLEGSHFSRRDWRFQFWNSKVIKGTLN